MKLHFPRPQIVSVAFIILSICSALYISLAGLNYLRFFPALAQVDSRVVNVIFVNGSNAVSLSSLVTVDNPTEYSGFRIQDITLGVYFVHPNATGFQILDMGLLLTQPLNAPLQPHSQVASQLTFRLTTEEGVSITRFNRTYSGDVLAHALLTVHLFTFLSSVTSLTNLESEEDLHLS